MKPKLLLTIALSIALSVLALSVSLVVASPASPRDSYTVYLPVVSKPCQPEASVYATINTPVAKVGDTLTVTGYLINECARLVGEPELSVSSIPRGMVSPLNYSKFYGVIPVGAYRSFTVTLQAIGPGQTSLDSAFVYEGSAIEGSYYWQTFFADPITVRILPP